jgi:hypothetical protein
MMIMFGLCGVGFIWLTRLFKGNRAWNVFFWCVFMPRAACVRVRWLRLGRQR